MIKNSVVLDSTLVEEEKIDNDSLVKLMNELGISIKNEDTYKLILWNDDVNDMGHIIKSLSDICKLSNEDCVSVMFEAHKNGKAVAKSGSYDEMVNMKDALNVRKINATVEK